MPIFQITTKHRRNVNGILDIYTVATSDSIGNIVDCI